EEEEVATAIGEQYQSVPHSKIGVGLALSDRLDSLVGLFSAGLAPTGTKDPFALRRAAIGVVLPLLEHNWDFDLKKAIADAAKLQPIEVTDEAQATVLTFIEGRLRVVLRERGYAHDVVDAVLAEQAQNPARAAKFVEELSAWVARDDWETIFPAYSRCVRIGRSAGTADNGQWTVDSAKLVEDAEKQLYAAIQKTVNGQPSTIRQALEAVSKLVPAINKFFDDVLVMDEDEAVKANRLALVGQIAGLTNGLADLSQLQGF
ncbi:MAG: glycine--tRNA ligase subunit beta, partial [Anaerolineales bacterium]|nr:glycine--tRNA ligase subunit beta [Anaerolineales bacterium]